MDTGIELQRVVRIGPRGRPSGKIHLTAVIPDSGDVHTLCGKTLSVAMAQSAEEPADCQACLRRRNNPSLVSAALFEAGLGARLLELSVLQAGDRAKEREVRTETRPQVVRPTVVRADPSPLPEPAERAGELRVRGLKEVGEDRFRSPAGVLIRLQRREGTWYVAELTHEGSILLRRRSDNRLEMRVGDVDIELDGEGAVRAVYSVR